MATKIGPKTVTQRDRSKALVFCVDAANSRSYGGEPTTNMITTDLSSIATLDSVITNGGLDGKTNAYVLTDDSASVYEGATFAESTNFVASTTYTLSFWLKQDDGATAKCHFRFYDATNGAYMSLEPDTRDGSVVMGTGSPVGYGLLETAADKHGHTWYRFYMTWTTASNLSSSSSHYIQILPAHDALGGGGSASNVGSITMWCPQVEAKAYATPCVGGDLAAGASRSASTAVKNISGVGAQGTTLTGTFASYGNTSLRAKRGRKVNLANIAQGHIGGAYWDLDGSDECIDLGQAADGTGGLSLKGYASLSICQWVNPDSVSSYYRTFYENRTSTANYYRVCFLGDSSDFGLYIYTSVTTTAASKGSALATGEWTHIAGTYDGANIRLYINGEEVGSTPLTGTVESSTGSYGGITIGARIQTYGQYLNGKVATTSVWSSSLTAKEIKDIYIAQKGRFGK